MSADEASVEEAATASGVGDREWNTTEGPLVVAHGLMFGFIINFTVLSGFRKVELFDVLSESRRQVTHQKVGLLDRFLWID